MKFDSSLKSLMSLVDDGVYFVDRDRRITWWNRAAERISGYSADEVVGRKCSDNLLRHVTAEGVQLCLAGCPLAGTMEDSLVRKAEVYMHHKNGHRMPVAVWAAPLEDESGNPFGAIELFTDRSDRSSLLEELEQLRHEVLVDRLTGLGNKRMFELVVSSRLEALKPGVESFGLFMADIDNFKLVNDRHGHLVGDRVLGMVGRTLSSVVRPLDAAIRWGGEEFILLCPAVPFDSLKDIAERIRIMTKAAYLEMEDGSTLGVTVSVGAAKAKPGDSADDIVKRADARMYEAKTSGRNCSIVGW